MARTDDCEPGRHCPSFLAADSQFVRDRTNRRIKMTIPGPPTVADSAKDEYYGDGMALAMELAAAIRAQKASSGRNTLRPIYGARSNTYSQIACYPLPTVG